MQVDRFPHLPVAFFRFKGCWVLPVERHMNFCFSEIPQSETRPPLAHRKGLPTKSQEYRVLSATLHDFGSPRLLTSISRAARD